MSNIADNLKKIKDRMKKCAQKSNRSLKDITLVAVTKTRQLEEMKEIFNLGITNIGENRIQEAQEKYEQLKDYSKIKWHMIGHLQSNKAKYAVEFIDMVHSLDRDSLAKELNKRAAKLGKKIDTLVQINIAKDKNKYGLEPDNTFDFILRVSEKYPNINIKGLMTIVPYVDNPETVRPYFRKMREKFDEIKDKNIKNVEMKYLSMGMTNDFEVAIEEGANMVRIGSGIFGPRQY